MSKDQKSGFGKAGRDERRRGWSSPTGKKMPYGRGVVGPRTGRRRDERRAKRREGGRIEEEHSTRGERVKSARRGRQTTGIASPDC